MLQCNGNAFRLAAFCDCSSHFSGNQRIFGIVLKVTSAKRISVDIHTRCKPDINTIVVCFHCCRFSYLLHQIYIPGTCKKCGDRPCSTGCTNTDTLRTVCRHGVRNAVFHQISHTSGICNTGICLTTHQCAELVIT